MYFFTKVIIGLANYKSSDTSMIELTDFEGIFVPNDSFFVAEIIPEEIMELFYDNPIEIQYRSENNKIKYVPLIESQYIIRKLPIASSKRCATHRSSISLLSEKINKENQLTSESIGIVLESMKKALKQNMLANNNININKSIKESSISRSKITKPEISTQGEHTNCQTTNSNNIVEQTEEFHNHESDFIEIKDMAASVEAPKDSKEQNEDKENDVHRLRKNRKKKLRRIMKIQVNNIRKIYGSYCNSIKDNWAKMITTRKKKEETTHFV